MMKATEEEDKQHTDGRILNLNITIKKTLFWIAIILCLSTLVSPPIALLMGFVIAQITGHPYIKFNHRATNILLQCSVVGLGFGMNIATALKVGQQGILVTLVSIVSTLITGLLLGRLLKIEKKTSYLISAGTAICGGSAIAAISPVIKAEEKQISIALGTIFVLNSVALLLFPIIAYSLHLSQTQFGLWCAVAIHDTSSVVGAAGKYGSQALEIATTVKLVRALWIIPITFLSAFIFRSKNTKVKIPYFIAFFVLAMAVNTYIPYIQQYSHYIVTVSKSGLTLTLFLIGCGLSKKALQQVGIKPLIQGVALWILISAISLGIIVYFTPSL